MEGHGEAAVAIAEPRGVPFKFYGPGGPTTRQLVAVRFEYRDEHGTPWRVEAEGWRETEYGQHGEA